MHRGGLLAGRLTDRPGSSLYVAGGVVSYSNEAKVRLLGVPADLIEAHGAVSPEVARAMADGARAALEADVGSGSPASRDRTGARRPSRWASCACV